MPDYYTLQQLSQKLAIPEVTIRELNTKGLLQPTEKNGRSYISARQAYRLGVAVRWARKDEIDLQEAFAKVEERWRAQTSPLKE